MSAPRAVRSFGYSGEINRTMAEDLALTCSVVFAGRTTVLRLLLGERVSRVRECRVSRGRASSGRRRLVFRLGYVEFDRTSVSVLYLLLSICAAARHLGRPVGKCAACENGVTERWVTSWWSEGQSRALQVGRGQRMTLFTVCGMAGNLFAVRERAREISNALMMVTGSEQSGLLMMIPGMA